MTWNIDETVTSAETQKATVMKGEQTMEQSTIATSAAQRASGQIVQALGYMPWESVVQPLKTVDDYMGLPKEYFEKMMLFRRMLDDLWEIAQKYSTCPMTSHENCQNGGENG